MILVLYTSKMALWTVAEHDEFIDEGVKNKMHC